MEDRQIILKERLLSMRNEVAIDGNEAYVCIKNLRGLEIDK